MDALVFIAAGAAVFCVCGAAYAVFRVYKTEWGDTAGPAKSEDGGEAGPCPTV